MSKRAIATRSIAVIALAGALTGIGTGVIAGTATAKPVSCKELSARITDAQIMAMDLEDQGNRLEAKRQYRVAAQLQSQYDNRC